MEIFETADGCCETQLSADCCWHMTHHHCLCNGYSYIFCFWRIMGADWGSPEAKMVLIPCGMSITRLSIVYLAIVDRGSKHLLTGFRPPGALVDRAMVWASRGDAWLVRAPCVVSSPAPPACWGTIYTFARYDAPSLTSCRHSTDEA